MEKSPDGTGVSPVTERSRWPPLTRMLLSGEMTAERTKELTPRQKFDRWMVNEGYRRFFVFVFAAIHAMVFAFGFMNYHLKDNLTTARKTFGVTYPIARAAALVLHFDVALILFPVCRTLISLARQTPLNGIIQFDKNITFHKLTAWSIVFFSWLHTVAHWVNFGQIAAKNRLGFGGWLLANFVSGPGWTGYVMLVALTAMALTSRERARRANFERFWYTHHFFVVFFLFWSLHGAFCMIQPDFAPFCAGVGSAAVGVFWQYWTYGGYVYLAERVARELRGRHRTYVTKVIQHPSNVCEIQLRKAHTRSRPGQYVFLCCPEVSLWQYHPFTLTSAPEEDYLSVHVRMVGDFTKALGRALGCETDKPRAPKGEKTDGGSSAAPPAAGPAPPRSGSGSGASSEASRVIGINSQTEEARAVDPALRRILPRIYVDGPFGSASEDVFKYEVALLCGAGIGVTPFASILKSIWYRLNHPGRGSASSSRSTTTRLRKVYFFWICRDFGSFEWFRELLLAIEAQDLGHAIEIHTYLTARIPVDDATNIMLHGASGRGGGGGGGGGRGLAAAEADDAARGFDGDAITGLRAPTSFGRPNWDAVFKGIRRAHDGGAGAAAATEAGVFFCGPKALGSQLHLKCNLYSEPGFNFCWGKENF